MSTDDYTQAWREAILILTRRDFSKHELSLKLKTKGHNDYTIAEVVTKLTESGYLNETRLVENFIHSRLNKGYGPHRTRLELQARGISEEMIAEQLHITDNAWLVAARKVWQKHFKGQAAKDFKTKAKQMRFLQYRGFTNEQIESVLDPYDN